MKKLFSLILGLMLFSFSNSFAVIEADITNIYSSKIIGNSGVLSYSFDVIIPKNGRKKGDYVRFNLRPNDWDIFNDYNFTNTNIEVIHGTKRGIYEVYFPENNGKIEDMKVRITGNVAANNLWNLLRSVRVIIGDLNGNGEDIKDWLTKDFFRHPNELEVKIKNMNLGKAYPGGILSTRNSFGGEPAEIIVKLSSLQNNEQKVKLEIMKDDGSSEYVTLKGPGKPFSADVWFEKNNSKSITLDLNKKDKVYETEAIKIEGMSKVPEGQTKGIYRGTIRVRVTYGK